MNIEERLSKAEALLAEAEEAIHDVHGGAMDLDETGTYCLCCKFLFDYEAFKDSILHNGELHR